MSSYFLASVMNEFTEHIQEKVTWFILFDEIIVLIDETWAWTMVSSKLKLCIGTLEAQILGWLGLRTHRM